MKRMSVLAALAVAVLVVTLLVQPNLVVGLRSPRALAWAAGCALACGAVGLIASRLGAKPVVALALAAVPAAAATALFVIEPIVNPRSLTEALPTVSTSPAAISPTTAVPSPTASDPMTTPRAPIARPIPARTTAAGPARVSTGALTPLAGHSAKGQVSTYRLTDGSHVIRFENVDIGGTPDPEVYLLSGRNRTGKSGGLHLGELKAEKGSFNYALPARFVGTDFTVLVWCERFAVDIAHATQAT